MRKAFFTISETIRDLIPPLLPEELGQLTENVRRDGCREPLVVWKQRRFLLDGHNRYAICRKWRIPFKTAFLSFPDDAAAHAWVIRNQFGRRNLSPYQRSELALKLEPMLTVKAKEKQSAAGRNKLPQNSAEATETREAVAYVAKVSHDTISKVKFIAKVATEETKEKLRAGTLTINKVHRDLKQKQKVTEIVRKAAEEEVQHSRPPGLVRQLEDLLGRYRTVLLDPPWRYRDQSCSGAAGKHYPTMTIEEIEALPVGAIVHPEGGHVWMWISWPQMRDGLHVRLFAAWGLEWKGEIVWHKPGTDLEPEPGTEAGPGRMGPGRWLRVETEILLLGVRGDCPRLVADVRGFRGEPRGPHSEKPSIFYSDLERFSPGPRIELFSRRTREGWDRWGYEAPRA